jgi:hypothetical protein
MTSKRRWMFGFWRGQGLNGIDWIKIGLWADVVIIASYVLYLSQTGLHLR